jgi:hypothetical protein
MHSPHGENDNKKWFSCHCFSIDSVSPFLSSGMTIKTWPRKVRRRKEQSPIERNHMNSTIQLGSAKMSTLAASVSGNLLRISRVIKFWKRPNKMGTQPSTNSGEPFLWVILPVFSFSTINNRLLSHFQQVSHPVLPLPGLSWSLGLLLRLCNLPFLDIFRSLADVFESLSKVHDYSQETFRDCRNRSSPFLWLFDPFMVSLLLCLEHVIMRVPECNRISMIYPLF